MNENIPLDLGTEKIGKLLRRYAVPAIIAMTAASLYNIVDSIFIGREVGAYAISGLAITFPFMNIAIAFATLIGVGASTFLSVLLGQKNYGLAKKVLGNVVILNIIIALVFSILSLSFLDPILIFFGASENTIEYARDYMEVILLGNIISQLYFGFSHLLRSSGHPRLSMYLTLLSVVVNIVLDAVFIIGLDMGIRGAAIATVISQIISLIWVIFIFRNKANLIHFQRGMWSLDKTIVKKTLHIGLPPFIINFVTCFVVIIVNKQLGSYGGDLAIGAHGIVNRVVFVFVMIVLGLTQGMQPIAGYNHGAKQRDRVKTVLKYTIYSAVGVMLFGLILSQIFAETLVSMFTTDKILAGISINGLKIIMLAMPLVGFQIVGSNFFQTIGLPNKSIFLTLTRQTIFLIPLVLILPVFWGTDGIWMSYPLSDLAATIVTVVMLWSFLKKY